MNRHRVHPYGKSPVIALLLVLLLVLQPGREADAMNRQTRVILYNINFGAVVGGIGALINKPSTVRWYRALLLGCIQGACGGFLLYEGKNISYLINSNERLEYGWLAKLVHATGVSVIENAASGRYFWETWNMHLGPLRIETFPLEGSARVRLLPYAAGTMVAAGIMGDFRLKETLQSGTPFYTFSNPAGGASMGNELLINGSSGNVYRTVTHEYVHVFQQREWTALNTFLLPVDKRLSEFPVYSRLSRYIYMDIPYFYFAYLYEGSRDVSDRGYYRNFFEMEADGFSTNFK